MTFYHPNYRQSNLEKKRRHRIAQDQRSAVGPMKASSGKLAETKKSQPLGRYLPVWLQMSNGRIQTLMSRVGAVCGGIVWIAGFVAGCGRESPELVRAQPAVQSKLANQHRNPTVKSKPNSGGVVFEDVALGLGLTHVWPTQPRPMRTNEAFGCYEANGKGRYEAE